MKPQGWTGEKQRHSMSAKGIQTKMPSMKRTAPTKKLLGKNYEWVEMDKREAFELVDEEGSFVVATEEDIWQAYRLEPTDNVVIVLKIPYTDSNSPGVQFSYMTLTGTADKLTDYNEDYSRYWAESSLRGAKWRSELSVKESVDVQISGVFSGVAKQKGITESDVDQEQLKRGIKTELEHTGNRDVAKIIALDHLAEDPEYYNKLEEAGL